MSNPVAGGAAPEFVDFPLPARADVNYTGAKVLTITRYAPDGTVRTWTSTDGGITFENVTPTTCIARHVKNIDGLDLAFQTIDGNDQTCVYRFEFSLTVDGVPVRCLPACREYDNDKLCPC